MLSNVISISGVEVALFGEGSLIYGRENAMLNGFWLVPIKKEPTEELLSFEVDAKKADSEIFG
jgi:hypothetical protein